MTTNELFKARRYYRGKQEETSAGTYSVAHNQACDWLRQEWAGGKRSKVITVSKSQNNGPFVLYQIYK